MNEIGERTRYSAGGTLSMLLLVLGAFFPSNASAQSRCDQTRQRIYQITSTEAAQVSDSLRMGHRKASFHPAFSLRRVIDLVSLPISHGCRMFEPPLGPRPGLFGTGDAHYAPPLSPSWCDAVLQPDVVVIVGHTLSSLLTPNLGGRVLLDDAAGLPLHVL